MKCYYLLLIFFLFVACENVTFSPLVGKWQLKTVEKNGEIILVDTVWYNFQSISIFALQIYEPQSDSYHLCEGMRTQNDNIVSIELISDWIIYHTDWNSVNRSFTIEELTRKRLLLRSEEGYLYSFIYF